VGVEGGNSEVNPNPSTSSGVSEVLLANERNMANGEAARAWLHRHWNKPTLLLFGTHVRCPQSRGGDGRSEWFACIA